MDAYPDDNHVYFEGVYDVVGVTHETVHRLLCVHAVGQAALLTPGSETVLERLDALQCELEERLSVCENVLAWELHVLLCIACALGQLALRDEVQHVP